VFDLVIRDATVVDGSGGAPFRGWVGVARDRIGAVERGDAAGEAARVVEASGSVLAPGFVDVHNHSDLSPLVLPEMPSTLRQGVTSVVVGNCGSSPWPLAAWDEAVRLAYADPADHPRPGWSTWSDFLDAIDAACPAVNVATLVGHGSVRQEALGLDARAPSEAALERMTAAVRDAVARGAVGVSTGLIYVPGIHSRTEEVVALAQAAGAEGGLYASHIRGEGRDLFTAVDEAIRIGRDAGLPVHVSHLKCETARVWGRAGDLLAHLHAGGATGDQYPYAAWNSSLASLLPPWAPVARIADVAAADRERLRRAVEEGEVDFQSSVDGVGWERIVISQTRDPVWNGMDLAAIAAAMDAPPLDAMIALLVDDPDTSCIGHAMDDADVLAILADPETFVASDASAIDPASPAGSLPVHPRDYGTFPRALALCRDRRLMPIETVIRTMTSLPADRFGLRGRGHLREGAFADLVLFDPNVVGDIATYERPHAFPDGIAMVAVNGVVAWEPGTPITRAGRALRRGA
jgi:N-acyl-D-amino-acid deacylase